MDANGERGVMHSEPYDLGWREESIGTSSDRQIVQLSNP